MGRCYHECLCGKVHRFKLTNKHERYFKCPVPVIRESKGIFGRKKTEEYMCGKPVVHLFYINGAYHASCEEHWTGKLDLYYNPLSPNSGYNSVELEDLE
jgi:hypothetical protein